MKLHLRDIAILVDGKLDGKGDVQISGTAILDRAGAGKITLVDRPDLARQLAESDASAVIVSEQFQPAGIPFITVRNVHEAFARIVRKFQPPRKQGRLGISENAMVESSAQIAENVEIHAGAMVGPGVKIGSGTTIHGGVRLGADCLIGENVTIFPNAVLYENTMIGDRSLIHAGAVLGAYGFGYDMVDGSHQLSAQLGNVEIGADVEIGACTTIDRGTYGPTSIGDGTKIDNQVMIGHNCRIGRHNMLCSQVGIAGSTSTGDYVVMAGQVGVRDHVHIGDQAVLGAKAGILNNIPAGETYVGIPATPERDQKLKQAAFAKLPEMRKQFKQLNRTVSEIVDRSKWPPTINKAA